MSCRRRWTYPLEYFHCFTPDDRLVPYAEAVPVDSLILISGTDAIAPNGERWGIFGCRFAISSKAAAADGVSHRASLELVDNQRNLLAAAQEEVPGLLAGTLPTSQYPLMSGGYQSPWMTFEEPIMARSAGSPLYIRQTNLALVRSNGFYIIDVSARKITDAEL